MPSLLQRRRLLAAGSTWTPQLLAPSDWWDFSRVGGAHNDPIGTVESLARSNPMTASGTARPLLQTGASGLGGRNVALFDGVDDVMTCSLSPHTTAVQVFAVAKRSANQSSNVFLSGVSSGVGFALYDPVTTPANNDNFYARGVNPPCSVTTSTNWRLLEIDYVPGTLIARVGGVEQNRVTITATSATGGARMGKGDSFTYWLNGCIGTVLCFDRQLSTAEAAQVRAWLNTYWGGGLA